jgi:hypothetical protein
MKKVSLMCAVILFCAGTISGPVHAEDMNAKIEGSDMSKSEVELRTSMRKLWESRAILLRDYIVKEIEGSEDAEEAKKELLENAGVLGASIRPYYGWWASSILTGFLKKDVGRTEEVIKAAKEVDKEVSDRTEKAEKKAMVLKERAGEKAIALVEKEKKEDLGLINKAKEKALELIERARIKALELIKKTKEAPPVQASKEAERALERAKKRWYSNASRLAGFFAIPGNHTKEELTDILYKHLDLTWGEIDSILNEDEAKELEYYEEDKAHMLMFSDMLVDGLIKQFPEKFKE